jgi:hypothetical protein
VVAYPVHHSVPKRSKGLRDIEFKVKAQVLKLNEGENATEGGEEAEKKAEKVEEVEKKAEKGEEKEEL